jgi:hypothetical protein
MGSLPLTSYGYLPQLLTFDEAACVPTAFANTFAALAHASPNLSRLIGETGSYADLERTRDTLASQYFFTSKDWVPKGSPASLVVEGTQRYAADLNVAQWLEIRLIGPGPQDPLADLANFNKTETISVDDPSSLGSRKTTPKVSTPTFDSLERQRLYEARTVTINDIANALDAAKGIVLGLIYTSGDAGHAVSAVSLDWHDQNNNGRADRDENATLTIVDPLDPSDTYSPALQTDVSVERLRQNPLIQATGPVRSVNVQLLSEDDGTLRWAYGQTSLGLEDGKLTRFAGDSSNGLTEPDAAGIIVFAGILNARDTVRDKITGSSSDDVIELDPGRDRIKGGDGSDLIVVGDALSLQKGNSDIITDFKPSDNDIIGLRGDELGIESIQLERVSSRRDLRNAARGKADLIYLTTKKYGLLYSNQNGEKIGLGSDGGELIRLYGAPDLTSDSIVLL